ncbi:hemerythrin domain-containing protein [Dactylosporangium sp. NPDC051485]|uniref:hemerythrin domain-containing protein n=1 Tax=Dactylosporangium sp. NPDC051485 TaxID=3154846 RepID=UPI0034439A18
MPADLIDLLVAEHRRLESLFADVETARTSDGREAALGAALAALERHSLAEERFLHPALREYLPAGPEIAAYEDAEHASFRRQAGDRAAGLFDAARQHMQEEETELFPRLAQACPARELRRLGDLLESVRVTE